MNTEIRSSSRDYSICCYCHKPATTKDHIPPKNMFPKPRPTNLITVPSCKDCNEDPSLDDEYFGLITVAASAGHPQARDLFRGKVKKKSKKYIALAKSILSNIITKDIYSGKIYLGTQDFLKIDDERINRIMIRITKGFYWYHFREPLPVKHEIKVSLQPKFDQSQTDMIISLKNNIIGDDILQYRYYRDPNNLLLTYWFFLFFEELMVMTTSDLKLIKNLAKK